MAVTLFSGNMRFICQVFASQPLMVAFFSVTCQVQVQGIFTGCYGISLPINRDPRVWQYHIFK